MVFSSLLFIFQFLPLTLIIYYIVPFRWKNLVLFITSLIFYSWGEFRYFPIMLTTIAVNYFCALGIEKFDGREAKRKLLLVLALVISFGFLFVFKYLGFFTENINALFSLSLPSLSLTLPLGISFYTFQTLSYTIDVYRRKVPAEHSFIDTAAFVTLFPQLIAGPIVRYSDIAKELKERSITPRMLGDGMEDFVLGLAKKVLIANNVGALWTEIEALGFPAVSTSLSWLGLLAFTLQIYFDFSGYSQMAIGLGQMLGFRFPQNFDVPYSSRSITEFWRRWHMTLGSWFREYLYFPLGGSRCSYGRTMFNLFIVWACTGFWHGASWNFILWGLYYFVLLSIEKAGFIGFLNKHKIFSRFYTVLAIMFGWALFAVTDLGSLGIFITRLFTANYVSTGTATVGSTYYFRNYAAVLLLGCFLSTDTARELYYKITANRAVKDIIILVLFFLSVAYLVDSTYNPFLYFRF